MIQSTMFKWALVVGSMMAWAALPVQSSRADDEMIKVGSLNSMTGGTSTFGQSTDKGIRLAAEERNATGGVLGRKIEVVTADTESSSDKTPQAVLKLLDQDKVVAILGEVASSRTMAAAPECQKAKIPLLTPASTNARVTRLGTYVFRSCFTDDVQGRWIARYAAQDLKAKRAVILTDTKNDYSKGLRDVISDEYAKLGGTIVGNESYQQDDSSFKTQLTNIKDKNPDIVFLPGYYTDVTLICKQARELGITCPFIGGDGWDSEDTLKNGGAAVEGCYFTNHYDANDPEPRVQEFVKKFKARYNNQVPDAMAVLGYDAANILFAAIDRAKSTEGPAIRTALTKTKDFPGVTGSITIDRARNAIKPGVVIEIKNGKFNVVKHMAP